MWLAIGWPKLLELIKSQPYRLANEVRESELATGLQMFVKLKNVHEAPNAYEAPQV